MRHACLLSLLVSLAASAQSERGAQMELRVNPLVAQLGTLYSEHLGSSLEVPLSPREGIAVGLTGRYFWVSRQSHDFYYDGREAGRTDPLLSTWAVLVSSELTPIRGEYSALGAGPLELALSLNAGLGAVGTRSQLKPSSEQTGPATYGDTGVRFGGTAGVGLTATLWRGLALHLGFEVLLYPARTSSVNGCNFADLDLLDRVQRNGGNIESLGLMDGCNVSSFSGTDPATGLDRGNDVPLARGLVVNPRSGVVNQPTLSLGASWAF